MQFVGHDCTDVLTRRRSTHGWRVAALREKLRANSQEFLEPGETIQAVFLVQTGPNPYLLFLTYLLLPWINYYAMVATDRRMLLLRSSMWRQSGVKEVADTLPRNTRLGPVSGLWARSKSAASGTGSSSGSTKMSPRRTQLGERGCGTSGNRHSPVGFSRSTQALIRRNWVRGRGAIGERPPPSLQKALARVDGNLRRGAGTAVKRAVAGAVFRRRAAIS